MSPSWRDRLRSLTVPLAWRERLGGLSMPSARDRLLVALAPDSVSWVRVRGLLKPRAIAYGALDADPAHGNDPWAGALAALAVQAEAWKRERLAVTVVLSNHFVRYTLMEPPPRGVSVQEELALARFHFGKLHGERAASWDVRVAPGKRGARRVASAIDRNLVGALQALFGRPGRARLVSIQPYLMCAFNRWRDRLGERGGWLVLSEPGRVCVSLLAGDTWTALQSVRSADDAPEEWLALVEREAQRTTVQPMPSTVLMRASADIEAGAYGPWQLVNLHAPSIEGMPTAERERYALALHAA